MLAFTWRDLILLVSCLLFTLCSATEENLETRAKAYPKKLKHISDKAHGVIMGLTVVVILPLGALSWRILGRICRPRILLWIHMCCQILGLAMLVTGFGLGIWVAVLHDEVCDRDFLFDEIRSNLDSIRFKLPVESG